MIVYIIPGKTKTVQDAVDYVADENKIAKNFNEFRMEYEASPEFQEGMTLEEFFISNVDDINRAVNYISNEDKVSGYISGYLCDPQFCEEEFRNTKIKNLNRIGKSLKDDTGNYFYHIIQSFPEGLEISDEEVHRCGVELVERLGLYQAVIASHIHPAVDEEGEVHGRCKHNHIIMNSHIYHEFVDETDPYKIKYNNCKETYAQLQLINDQIAIEHGLPIIAKPDMERVYSWKETDEKNKGKSWKERVRIDISNAMRSSTDLDSFVESMEASGYKLRVGNSDKQGQYIAYTCPDDKHKVRDYVLGKGSTLPELQTYWNIKNYINEEINDNRSNAENKIEKILESSSEPLYLEFKKSISERRQGELREKNINYRNTYTNYLPLDTSKTYSQAELSYFDSEGIYNIVNENHQPIAEISGQDVLDYYRILREREQQEKQEEEKLRKQEELRAYYSDMAFRNSTTREPYKIRLYNEHGRRRSLIEVILILALVTIQNEAEKWMSAKNQDSENVEYEDDPIYANVDWKVQQMMDTIKIAREENIQNPADIQIRINETGKNLSKCRAEIRRLTASLNRMDSLREAIINYEEVKEICERIQAMPDGPQKTEMQKRYAEEIASYKESKAIMYRQKTTSEEGIQEFKERLEEYKNKIQYAEAQNKALSEEYRRLQKLNYNVQLAQNKAYCYGPEYVDPEDIRIQEEEERRRKEEERKEKADKNQIT